jgi:hypothetical protein
MQHWGWLCCALVESMACLGPCLVTPAILKQLGKPRIRDRVWIAVFVAGPEAEEHVKLCWLKVQSEELPEGELQGCLRGNDLVLAVAQPCDKPLVGAFRVDELAVTEYKLGVVLRSTETKYGQRIKKNKQTKQNYRGETDNKDCGHGKDVDKCNCDPLIVGALDGRIHQQVGGRAGAVGTVPDWIAIEILEQDA